MFKTTLGLAAATALMGATLASAPAQAGSTRDAVHSGALIGATKKNHHRDRYGRSYYTDRHGYRRYR